MTARGGSRFGTVIAVLLTLAALPAPPVSPAECPAEGWHNGRLGSPGLMARRYSHAALWTGTRMIVIGGSAGMAGEIYDPVPDTAKPMSMTGAPAFPEHGFTLVWTGGEMILWGTTGTPPDLVHAAGRYDPVTDVWRPISMTGAPPALIGHTAVWTGTRMVVAGGQGPVSLDGLLVMTSAVPGGGGSYDPVSDTWSPGPDYPRAGHAMVWTGTNLILLGGECVPAGGATPDPCTGADPPGPGVVLPDGGAPRSIATDGAPSFPPGFTAEWSGSEVLVWGARFSGRVGTTSMGRYDPAQDLWRPMAALDAPSPRLEHTAVWTGGEMIVWGGSTPTLTGALGTGARYDPESDAWQATSLVDAPSPRDTHSAVWSGTEMIIWGGFQNAAGALDTGGRYSPPDRDADRDGTSLCEGDCDDGDDRVFPGAPQACGDGLNNDCLDPAWPSLAGTIEADDDGDGSSECLGDCDDAAAGVHPAAPDLPGNAIDEDCDGAPACDPASGWQTRGRFGLCVVRQCRALEAAGLVTPQECAAIVRQAMSAAP